MKKSSSIICIGKRLSALITSSRENPARVSATKPQPSSVSPFIAIRLLGLAIILSFLSAPVCTAADKQDKLKPFRSKDETRELRRHARKQAEKQAQEAKRKLSSGDTLRLDQKLNTSAIKISDAKIRDQKYLSAEMRRERKEARLEPHELGTSQPIRAKARKELLAEKEKADP